MISILGQPYEILYRSESEAPKLIEANANGLAELFSKKIIVKKMDRTDPLNYENIDAFELKVLRHEILHAIFFESGCKKYCDDEDLIEYISIMFNKILCVIQAGEQELEIIKENDKFGYNEKNFGDKV